MNCPECNSSNVIKNGSINNGKKKIPAETWEIVDKLLLERLPIAGISRVTGISEQWLQQYINKKYEKTPQNRLK